MKRLVKASSMGELLQKGNFILLNYEAKFIELDLVDLPLNQLIREDLCPGAGKHDSACPSATTSFS